MSKKQDPRQFADNVRSLRTALSRDKGIADKFAETFPGLARALNDERSDEYLALTKFIESNPSDTYLMVGPMKDHEPIIICVF